MVEAPQANWPVPTRQLLYYYEVQVKDHGARGRIGVGFADRTHKLSRQPGCVCHRRPTCEARIRTATFVQHAAARVSNPHTRGLRLGYCGRGRGSDSHGWVCSARVQMGEQ